MTGLLPAVNVVLLGLVLTANGLASALPINGRTTGQISDSFPLIFVPAGYVFAIWGLIYVALIAHVGYGLTRPGRTDARNAAIGWWLPLNFAANTSWILTWHYGLYPVSLALMLVILVSLKAVHGRLDAIDQTVAATRRSYWLVRFPMSLYQGWISVATIANVSVVLLDAGWTGGPLSQEAWALVMVALATALNLVMVLRVRDLAFGSVGVWALAGIAAKRASDFPVVAGAANGGALLIALAMIIAVLWMVRPAAPTKLTA